MKDNPIIIERTFNAPIEKVWKAITDKKEMKEWYFDLEEFKTEVGFEFQFTGGTETNTYLHLCKIKEVIPDRKISYSWIYDGYKGESLVSFELFPEGEKTRLKLTHSGLESFAVNNNSDFDRKNFVGGWTHIINIALQEYLESH